MLYNLTPNQSWHSDLLYSELISNSFITEVVIIGHGEKSFEVFTDDDASADINILLHLDRLQSETDAALDALDKSKHMNSSFQNQKRDIHKAFMLTMLSEINILRNEIELLKGDSSLPNRTASQLRNAIRNKL